MLNARALSSEIQKRVATGSDTWEAISEAIISILQNTVEVNEDFLPHTHDRRTIQGLTADDIFGINAAYIGLGNVTNESKATMFTAPTFTGTTSADILSANSLVGDIIGIDNTASNSGKGLSLYGGAVSGKPTYGMMFAGTATFGTHGDVTGDWATYFTINRNDARGWIFKSSDLSDTTGNYASISGRGYIYGVKVFGAVYNDIADFIEVDEDTDIEYGCTYCRDSSGKIKKTFKRGQASIGLASDTFGFSMGRKEDERQIPIALGGWALANVDKIYKYGEPLVATKAGKLTKAPIFTKLWKPYRIIAFFDREEKNGMWHDIEVKGRHWVKVVG